MNEVLKLCLVATVGAITGCASLQVERDLKHAQLSAEYRSSLESVPAFSAAGACETAGTQDEWTTIEFGPTTARAELPNGVKASAMCIGNPSGSRILQLHADAKGGMTYHELAIVHPSLLFLDDAFKVVGDLQRPRLSPGSGFFSGLGLSGNVVLEPDFASAKYAVVYVHPLSLDGAINVQTGYQSIPVPYGPYGLIKIRFK